MVWTKVSTTSALNPPKHRRITFATHPSHRFSPQSVSPLSAQELRVSQRHHGQRHRGHRLPIRIPSVQWSHKRGKAWAKVIRLPAIHLRSKIGAPTKLTELRIPRVGTLPKDLLLAPDRHQDRCLLHRSLPIPVSVARDPCPRQRLHGVHPPAPAAALDRTCRPLSRSSLEASGIIDSNSTKIRSIAQAVPSVYKSNGFFKSPTRTLPRILEGPYTIQMLITLRDHRPLPLTTPRVLLLVQVHPRHLQQLRIRVPLPRQTGKDDRSIREGKRRLSCIWMEDCTSSLFRACKRVLHHLPIRNKNWPFVWFSASHLFFFPFTIALSPPTVFYFPLHRRHAPDLSPICYLMVSQ